MLPRIGRGSRAPAIVVGSVRPAGASGGQPVHRLARGSR